MPKKNEASLEFTISYKLKNQRQSIDMATTNKKVVTKLLQAKRKNKKMNKKVTKPFQSNEMAKMNKKVTQSFQCDHWPLRLHCQTSQRFE